MFACFDHDATSAKALINPFTAIPIRADAVNLVLTKKAAELFNRLLWAKRRTYFAHSIEHAAHALFMRNGQREAIACTAARINERAIDVAPIVRPFSDTAIDARLDA